MGCLDECGRSGFAKVTDLLPAEGAGFLAEDMHMTSVASRISALVMPGVLLPIEMFLHVASFCAPASFEPPGLVKAARLANPWSGEGATMCMGVPPSTCSVGDPRRCSLSFINDAGDRDGSGVRPIPWRCCPLPGVCMYELHGENAGAPEVVTSSTRRKPPE